MTDLDDQLGKHRIEVRTEQWSVSIGEVASLYERSRLKINPAFQRYFRWSDQQKSLLVESVLLGFPIPPVFFAQNEEGVLEVVDGVQRLSTLLQLMGLLKGPDGESVSPFVLTSGQYLSELDGLVWDEEIVQSLGETNGLFAVTGSLTEAQRSDIEFAKLDATIIKRSSSEQSKYDVFRRLNSYGEPLTPQEMRGAIIASIDGDFLAWLEELAFDEAVVDLFGLSESQIERQYDVELVLRFMYLTETDELTQSKLRDFPGILDDYAVELAEAFPGDRVKRLGEVFESSMALIEQSAGRDFFRKFDLSSQQFRGGFLNTSFEALGTSIGYRRFRELGVRSDLISVAKEFWGREEFQARFATGRSTEWRISTYVPMGREMLASE